MHKQRVLSLGWVLVAWLFLSPPAWAGSDQTLSQRLAEQVATWYERAEQGDAGALFNLGQYFRKGVGIKPDLEQARRFYLRAAELGHPEAQLNLGTLYYFDGGTPNYDQSRHWWLQAARQGNVDAQYQLAILYLKQPDPVPLDALAWMTLAARAGDTQAVKAQALLAQELSIIPAQLEARIRELGPASDSVEVDTFSQPVARAGENNDASEEEPSDERGVVAESDSATQAVSHTAPELPQEEMVAVREQAAGGGFAVQLASLSEQAVAVSLADRLKQQLEAVLLGRTIAVVPVSSGAKTAYKVRVTGFADHSSANMLCRELKQQQQPCFVVKG
ncbi:hypothetical protein GCM10009104_20530 [Marinobacterium maritimum]|uniref:SPOR domain-containing protein n=1 Tax=Marinobacterium maritimum TaxID=500162 RepID=A0ABN1I6S3_9GAMM